MANAVKHLMQVAMGGRADSGWKPKVRSPFRNGKNGVRYLPVPREFFVLAWQTLPTIDLVVEYTGLARGTVIGRASLYRVRGINLKTYHNGGVRRVDVKALNRLMQENPVL